MDFRVGSALAALEDIGNQASDIHVFGGKYGIITKRTAPVWQFLLMDSSFEGQRCRKTSLTILAASARRAAFPRAGFSGRGCLSLLL